MSRLPAALFLGLALTATACTSGGGETGAADSNTDSSTDADSTPATTLPSGPVEIPELVAGEAIDYGPAPVFNEGDLAPEVAESLEGLRRSFSLGLNALTVAQRAEDFQVLADSGDARLLWVYSDLLRFPLEGPTGNIQVADAFEQLSGTEIGISNPWGDATNRLIAWDVPAPPGYLEFKRSLFTTLEPKWEPLFADGADIDWRHVSWGGVLIDDRPLGATNSCARGCIPALDEPVVTDAAGGDWYPDDETVFGVVINGEARAYPKNIMEVHEMTNDVLGGRRIAIPYCTLCGSAQAWFTDELDADVEFPVLRTSGLLIRSNKMMFDLTSLSFVDTFLGNATSGPLQDAGVQFEQASVVASSWGEWKAAHPDTTIVAEDGGIGRSYPLDPLRGRDDDGPIFPIGDVDPRLPVQENVLGVIAEDGTPIAVHVAIARATLQNGEAVEVGGYTIELDGDGIRALDGDGNDVGAHQAFWFAWSQFRPDTELWPS